MIILPINRRPADAYTITIEDKQYTLRFVYLDRVDAWYFSIGDSAGPIVNRIKVVRYRSLLSRYRYNARLAFTGEFYCLGDINDRAARPGRDTFGTEYPMVYLTAAELLNLRAAPATYPEVTVS